MNRYFRSLLTWLQTLSQPRIPLDATRETAFMVWPHEVDPFGLFNTSRFLGVLDVERHGWMVRTGAASVVKENQWRVAMGGTLVRHQYALRAWQRYRVTTHMSACDRGWIYLEQRVIDQHQRCVAVACTRVAVRECVDDYPGDDVTVELFAQIGESSPPKRPLPSYLGDWRKAEERMFKTACTDIRLNAGAWDELPRLFPILDRRLHQQTFDATDRGS